MLWVRGWGVRQLTPSSCRGRPGVAALPRPTVTVALLPCPGLLWASRPVRPWCSCSPGRATASVCVPSTWGAPAQGVSPLPSTPQVSALGHTLSGTHGGHFAADQGCMSSVENTASQVGESGRGHRLGDQSPVAPVYRWETKGPTVAAWHQGALSSGGPGARHIGLVAHTRRPPPLGHVSVKLPGRAVGLGSSPRLCLSNPRRSLDLAAQPLPGPVGPRGCPHPQVQLLPLHTWHHCDMELSPLVSKS